LLVSLELDSKKWRLTASDGGARLSEYRVDAGDGAALLGAIERARARALRCRRMRQC
jgi:hypothetical protein